MKRFLTLFLCFAGALFAQSQTGELHLKVTDPAGLGVKSTIVLASEANEFRESLSTDDSGAAVARRVPFGLYRIEVHHEGFAPYSATIEVTSAVPLDFTAKLAVAAVNTSVVVSEEATLIDPYRTGSVNRIGSQTIEDRATSLPGRSLQDLVDSQPGWLYEGNAVLHPRGSEYQTQFVIDGIPLTDNRSPSFGPEIEADDVQSMTVYTAGIPAEYGRKMGGVVEVETAHDTRQGLHGELVLSGGSFDTAGAYTRVQYLEGKNTFGFSADGDTTGWYLNPPVTQNFTNTGTTGDFSGDYERDFTASDRLTLSVRHEFSRFDVPNEQVQEEMGQLQNRNNYETLGVITYQHIFSPDLLGNVRAMVRDDSDALWSNQGSFPIIASQHRGFREGYVNASVSYHHGRHEWKAGIESDNTSIHEQFSYTLNPLCNPANPNYDPAICPFDPATPLNFSFPAAAQPSAGYRPDLEQSGYIEDLIRLGKWTLSAGLRWDHYQLIVNENAASPRLGLARYFQSADLVLHVSYDRVFQTPAFENILLSSSPLVTVLNPNVLRVPVEPSHGDYYEAGVTKGFFGKFRLEANYFRRNVNNYADDDQLLDTSISFPIAFRNAILYGAEGKLDVPHWGRLSGYVSYSYIVGNAWFPVTGGLFLGDDAVTATTTLSGHFPDSQDQRNTVRTRFRYQLWPRLWVAGGADYGSGLPIDPTLTETEALDDYGPQIVNRVNFARDRVRPSLSIDVSVGADVWKSDKFIARLQADGINLNDRLNVIDFAGLFSGTAIAPPRTYALRLSVEY